MPIAVFTVKRAWPLQVALRHAAVIVAFLATVSLAAMMPACRRGGDANGDALSAAVFPYPTSLSPESSPIEVARALVRALDEDDKQTLLGLVAVKAAVAEMNEIFRKHGRTGKTKPKSAAAMAAAGWSATYVFFQQGETVVEREVIQRDTATVFANGKTPDGKPRMLKITLLREDGLWKVRAGLESLPPE